MSDLFDTNPVDNSLIPCPSCGTYIPYDALECDECHYVLADDLDDESRPTHPLRRPPAVPRMGRANANSRQSGDTIILQFLPSGTCIAVQLDTELVLGREYVDTGERFLSLSEFNGDNHGVSRQHCSLRRRGSALLVTDLGSTNGTLLNGDPLIPHEDYVVNDGDRLVLGSLHMIVSYGS